MRSRTRQVAVWLSVAAGLVGGPASAADTSNGSKNFNVPTSVPNYFSNEAGPMIGGAAESRRGALYSSQPATIAAPVVSATAAMPRVRQHIAMAEPRGRLVRGHRGAPAFSHHVALHGRAPARIVSRGGGRTTHTASRATTHAASRPTRVSSAHHHGRG